VLTFSSALFFISVDFLFYQKHRSKHTPQPTPHPPPPHAHPRQSPETATQPTTGKTPQSQQPPRRETPPTAATTAQPRPTTHRQQPTQTQTPAEDTTKPPSPQKPTRPTPPKQSNLEDTPPGANQGDQYPLAHNSGTPGIIRAGFCLRRSFVQWGAPPLPFPPGAPRLLLFCFARKRGSGKNPLAREIMPSAAVAGGFRSPWPVAPWGVSRGRFVCFVFVCLVGFVLWFVGRGLGGAFCFVAVWVCVGLCLWQCVVGPGLCGAVVAAVGGAVVGASVGGCWLWCVFLVGGVLGGGSCSVCGGRLCAGFCRGCARCGGGAGASCLGGCACCSGACSCGCSCSCASWPWAAGCCLGRRWFWGGALSGAFPFFMPNPSAPAPANSKNENKKTRRQEDKKTRRQEDKKTRRQETKRQETRYESYCSYRERSSGFPLGRDGCLCLLFPLLLPSIHHPAPALAIPM